MTIKLANNAETLLATDISAAATSMVVEDASSFPVLGSGEYFYCTLQRTSGSQEIVKVTGISGTTFTIVRGQESTAAISFSSGSTVALRLTVQSLTDTVTDLIDSSLVSDTAYNATTWNGVTGTAPSKNAVRDVIESTRTSSAMLPVTQASTLEGARAALFEGVETPIVLVVSGQSNALLGAAYTWTPPSNIFVWNWDLDPTHVGTAFAAPSGTISTLALGAADEIARANPYRDVYVVNIARSGTPIANWIGGSPDMYAAVKDNVEAALVEAGVNTISALVWWQGEDDATSPTGYVADFQTLHADWRGETWFPWETPIVVMGTTVLSSAEIADFNQYLVDLEQTSSAISYVNTSELPAAFWDATPPYTYLHMNGIGYHTAGRMAGQNLLSGERSSTADSLRSPTYRAITISADVPSFFATEADQAADAKHWWVPLINGGTAAFGPVSDALALTTAFSIGRTGVTDFGTAPTFTSTAATTRTNLGLGSSNSPTFAGATLSGTSTALALNESDQAANAKLWWAPFVEGGTAAFGPVSDALSLTTSFTIGRSGVTNFAISPTFTSPTGTRTNLGVGTGDSPTFAGAILSGASTALTLNESDQAADAKLWWAPFVNGGTAAFGPVSDALVLTTAFTIGRTGVTDFAIAPTFTSTASTTRTNLGVAYASASETRAKTSSTKVLSPSNLADLAKFRAHKNGTDQASITDVTATKVTFGSESYDVGSLFDTTNSRWTPPAGYVELIGTVLMAGVAAGGEGNSTVMIYKNGAALASTIAGSRNATFGTATAQVIAHDLANGTDYYEVYVNIDAATTGTVSGGTTVTYFLGKQI